MPTATDWPATMDRGEQGIDMTIQTFTTCPDCGDIAEIRDHFVLSSTDGPIEHLRILCVRRHRFVLPTAGLDRIPTMRPPTAPAAHPTVGKAN